MVTVCYCERWAPEKIFGTLQKENEKAILTRISPSKFEQLTSQRKKEPLDRFDFCRLVTTVGKFRLDQDNSAVISESELLIAELASYDNCHLYDPTLQILFHKSTVQAFIANVRIYVRRLTENFYDNSEVIGIISAGQSELDLVCTGFIFLILNGKDVLPRVDFGIDNIRKTASLLKEINRNSINIVTAGMEAALFSVVGNLSFRPILAVPSHTSYGLGKDGEASMFASLESDVPGLAIFNNTNILGACTFASNYVETLRTMKERNASLLPDLKEKLSKQFRAHKNSSELQQLLYAGAVSFHLPERNEEHSSRIANQIRHGQVPRIHEFSYFQDAKILVIQAEMASLQTVEECISLFKSNGIRTDVLPLDVVTLVLRYSHVAATFRQYDCILVVGKNCSLSTLVGSVAKSEGLQVPIVALPTGTFDTFATMINSCTNNIALLRPNDVKNGVSFVLSLLCHLGLDDLEKTSLQLKVTRSQPIKLTEVPQLGLPVH